MKSSRINQIAIFGVFVALAFVFSRLESLLPNPLEGIVPGLKLGLANLVVMIALLRLGFLPAAAISLLRVLLTAFTFGNLSMFFYSLAGAALSLLVMQLMKSLRFFGSTGISILGGLAHNLGQILVAMLVLGSSLLYYLPYLILGGSVSGLIIGLLAALILRRLPQAPRNAPHKP